MIDWLRQLSARERWLVGGGAAIVFGMGYFLAVLDPLQERVRRAERGHAAQQELAGYLERAAAELAALGSGPSTAVLPSGESLIGAVNKSVEAVRLAPHVRRLTPVGESQVDVSLEAVPLATLLEWLIAIDRDYGLRVARLALNGRAREPGVVDATIGLRTGAF